MKLTFLRALDLLTVLDDTSYNEAYRLREARRAITEHIRAGLTPPKRRRKRRAKGATGKGSAKSGPRSYPPGA